MESALESRARHSEHEVNIDRRRAIDSFLAESH
jgi:hypothetical protein